MLAEAKSAITAGWHAANFSRAKRLEKLDHYLSPPLSAERRRDQDARRLIAMLDRLAEEEAGNGAR